MFCNTVEHYLVAAPTTRSKWQLIFQPRAAKQVTDPSPTPPQHLHCSFTPISTSLKREKTPQNSDLAPERSFITRPSGIKTQRVTETQKFREGKCNKNKYAWRGKPG